MTSRWAGFFSATLFFATFFVAATASANCQRARPLAQRCQSEGQSTMQTCDANQDPELQKAKERGEQLNNQFSQSGNIQKTCKDTKDFNQQFNSAMQKFRQKCDQAQQSCNSTCDQAMSAASSCPAVMGMVQDGKQNCTEAQRRVSQTGQQQQEAVQGRQEAQHCQNEAFGGADESGLLSQKPDSWHNQSACSDPEQAMNEPTCICRFHEGSSSMQCQPRQHEPVAEAPRPAGGVMVGVDGITRDTASSGWSDGTGSLPEESREATASADIYDGTSSGGGVAGPARAASSSSGLSVLQQMKLRQIAAQRRLAQDKNASLQGASEARPTAASLGLDDEVGDEENPLERGARRPSATSEEEETAETSTSLGIHGPEANLFAEVHGRYESLFDSLIQD